MTIHETEKALQACADALQERLAGAADPEARQRLGEKAHRETARIGKPFRRRIDRRALRSVYDRHWFAVNEHEGLEAALERALSAAARAINEAVAGNAASAESSD